MIAQRHVGGVRGWDAEGGNLLSGGLLWLWSSILQDCWEGRRNFPEASIHGSPSLTEVCLEAAEKVLGKETTGGEACACASLSCRQWPPWPQLKPQVTEGMLSLVLGICICTAFIQPTGQSWSVKHEALLGILSRSWEMQEGRSPFFFLCCYKHYCPGVGTQAPRGGGARTKQKAELSPSARESPRKVTSGMKSPPGLKPIWAKIHPICYALPPLTTLLLRSPPNPGSPRLGKAGGNTPAYFFPFLSFCYEIHSLGKLTHMLISRNALPYWLLYILLWSKDFFMRHQRSKWYCLHQKGHKTSSVMHSCF